MSLERKQVTDEEVIGEERQEEVAEVFWYVLILTCAWPSGFHEERLVRKNGNMITR